MKPQFKHAYTFPNSHPDLQTAQVSNSNRVLARVHPGASRSRASTSGIGDDPGVTTFAFRVSALVEQRDRVAKESLSQIIIAAQARDFGLIGERTRMLIEHRFRESFGARRQRRESARGDPLAAVFLNYLSRALEIFGFEQVMHGLLPSPALKKVISVARMFRGEARAPQF